MKMFFCMIFTVQISIYSSQVHVTFSKSSLLSVAYPSKSSSLSSLGRSSSRLSRNSGSEGSCLSIAKYFSSCITYRETLQARCSVGNCPAELTRRRAFIKVVGGRVNSSPCMKELSPRTLGNMLPSVWGA